MKYDFTSILDRSQNNATAFVNLPGQPKDGFDPIPMWIADMNFSTVPTVTESIIDRVSRPDFGYFVPPAAYYDSIIRWQNIRNNVTDLTPECIGYENGVLGCGMSTATAFSLPGDRVLINSPNYCGFDGTIGTHGYKMIYSPLKQDENNVWRMDFDDMDKQLKEHDIHLAIFCSPHNPCGRVWERWEIEKAMEVYRKNDCIVISDEIWSDIILDGHKHIPTQSVSEDAKNRTVAIYAPSKTFNLAGLVGSYHIIYNKYLRDKVRAASSRTSYNHMNVLSMHALLGAYTPEGHEWLDELCQVLTGNADFACDFITENFPGVRFCRPQGTYMMFIDVSTWCIEHNLTLDDVLKAGWDVGVEWLDGRIFNAPYSIRINLASPLSRIQEAFDRLNKYVFVQ